MAAPITAKNVLVLLLLAVLPLAALSSRTGPPAIHKSHGHGHRSSPSAKHPPPPPPSSPPSAPPTASPPTAAALVRATCNSTAYYDLCVSALAADPSSATADVRGLSAIAVSVAAANASGGAATATALAANGTAPAGATASASTDGTVQALLHVCAAKYASARDALAAAGDSIALQDYDFASVHVSAAAEYPQVCRTLFRRQRPGDYPPELAAREETLKQLCSVALDIIALLSNSSYLSYSHESTCLMNSFTSLEYIRRVTNCVAKRSYV